MRRVFWVAVGLLTAGSALAQDPRVAAGREVAQRWCVNCHVVGPEQTRGSDQVPSLRSIAEKPGTNEGSLHAFLSIPHGKMPDQALSNADVDAVAAYILSLKR